VSREDDLSQQLFGELYVLLCKRKMRVVDRIMEEEKRKR